VTLYDIRPARPHQDSLFGRDTATDEALMAAVDQINQTMGRGTLGTAAAAHLDDREWTMERSMRSPRYTTRWDELPVARA